MKPVSAQFFIFIALAVFSLTACNPDVLHASAPVRIKDPWLRWNAETNTAELYFYIANHSPVDDALVAAGSALATDVEFYSAPAGKTISDIEQVPAIELPVETGLILLPGGPHIRLTGLKEELTPGKLVPITLKFKLAGEFSFYVEAH